MQSGAYPGRTGRGWIDGLHGRKIAGRCRLLDESVDVRECEGAERLLALCIQAGIAQHQFRRCAREGHVEQEALLRIAIRAIAHRDLAAAERAAQGFSEDGVRLRGARECAFEQAADEDDGQFPLPGFLSVDQLDGVAAEFGRRDRGVAERGLRGFEEGTEAYGLGGQV